MIAPKSIIRTLVFFTPLAVSLNAFSQAYPDASVSVSSNPSNNPDKPLDQPFAKLKEEVRKKREDLALDNLEVENYHSLYVKYYNR